MGENLMGFPIGGPKIKEVPFEFTEDHIKAIANLHCFFDSDEKKVANWLNTKNLNLGGISGKTLWFMRPKKLNQWITNQLEGNLP
jgi:hypothetical protein